MVSNRKAFYNALGNEQAVKRLSTFFEQGPSSFTNKPFEQIISDIDIHVDKTFGKTCSTYTDAKQRVHSPLTSRLVMKYSIIFQVALNLPIEFKQMRTYLLQSSSAALSDISLLIDIPEWMELLTKEFTSKGILHDYTSANIPASKKELNVNGVTMKSSLNGRKLRSLTVLKQK